MKLKVIFILSLTTLFFACKNNPENKEENREESEISINDNQALAPDIQPISHGSLVLQWDDAVLYADPVGGKEAFEGKNDPDLILITHQHGDHFHPETLEAVMTNNTKIILPQSVADLLPEDFNKENLIIMANDETHDFMGMTITTIPMYNLREEALNFHPKGRGNGYVIEKNSYRVYISGDTEDIPEMRNLQDIDLAFVCMNLPYTMTAESAASAVSDFKPNTVVPYHFRGAEGFSDVDAFEKQVQEKTPEVEVLRLEWYPERSE
ncbi:MAG: MBL fold metallo-hydrolase [Flavobacteriaceae bacterium]